MQSKTPLIPALPTVEAYAELQAAFEHFNEALFGGHIPHCLITFQREKTAYGYFSSERFVHRDGTSTTDEIAINPSFFAVVPIGEVLQTIVHEMVHAWQFHFGTPSRRGYHNHEWAEKMEAVGLMPSHTGEAGGKKTGEKMGDYAIAGGPFETASAALLAKNFKLSWLDRFPPAMGAGRGRRGPGAGQKPGATPMGQTSSLQGLVVQGAEGANKSNRIKQRCPECGAQAWGKPGLKLCCGEEACAGKAFVVAAEKSTTVEPSEPIPFGLGGLVPLD